MEEDPFSDGNVKFLPQLVKLMRRYRGILFKSQSDKETPEVVMSRERLPLIGSHRNKTTAKPPLSSSASRHKRSRHQTSSSSSHPRPGPSSILLLDSSVAPWAGGTLLETSFTSIPLPPPPPPPPPAPRPTPSTTPFPGRRKEVEEDSSSSLHSRVASLNGAAAQDNNGGESEGSQARRRGFPQRRPPRLPPLHPVTNLSFSRSFTFSFFELPLHHSPRCRAERTRNLMLLLKQIHF